MHKGHLAGCAVGIVLALGFVAITRGSAGGLGLLVAALACPIAMVVAMKFLMGGRQACGHDHHGHDQHDAHAARAAAHEEAERA